MSKEHRIFDEVTIYIKAGDGGSGCASFRREKFIPDGGPNGGDGGSGGDVIIRANPNINTLQSFRYKKKFIGQNGEGGMGNEKTGKSGENLIIEVPPGTAIYTERGDSVFDITPETPQITIAKGGKGGLGNTHFKSSTNQAPRQFTIGNFGESGTYRLVLKMISDIGIIGMPNAGKSSFLAAITNAKPKIGNYAFTTISPNLGIVEYNFKQIVMADIPGLIEGANAGSGLGIQFLKHIERTKMLIHIVDISNPYYIENYHLVRRELEEFDKTHGSQIAQKREMVILNKSDCVSDAKKLAQGFTKKTKIPARIFNNFTPEMAEGIIATIYEFYSEVTS